MFAHEMVEGREWPGGTRQERVTDDLQDVRHVIDKDR